ncbi:MAG: putative Ig domain-containing protein, partial [Dermatophilaceae bacterium]|nr:putative Ig domain-containing protein [Dermatophilaceae bacterium]
MLSVLGSMLLGTVASPAGAVASAISVTPSSGPFVFTAGSAITPVTFSATGGGAITYVVAPSLPTPLALDTNTGILSGTPSAAVPDAPYTVTATDASDNSTSQVVVNISVVAAPPPLPGIAPNSQTITGTVGAGITPTSSFTPTALTAPLKFALNGILPAGLTMDVDTGIITGTPSVLAAALPFTITATDSSASPLQVTSSLSVTVTAGVLSPAAQAPVTGVAGVALASPTARSPVSA